jgi:methyl-accepting chemotaxis protein
VQSWLVSWRALPGGERLLVAGLPARAYLAQVGSSRAVFALLLGASLGVALAVAWLLAEDLGGSLRRLCGEAERIASGDLTSGAALESEDELGELGRAFERMRAALREMVSRVAATADGVDAALGETAEVGRRVSEATAAQVEDLRQATQTTKAVREQVGGIAESAQALAASIEESSSSILEMGAAGEELSQTASVLSAQVDEASGSIEQIHRAADEMGGAIDALLAAAAEASSSIEEMAGSMREVDANAAETARLSAHVVEEADGGQHKVHETMLGMEAIRESSETAERVIRELGARAGEIGAILDVIDDVADETNLLALNAAIIAAQAGEHGRAFSVVADEIKELADRVMASTKEIGGLIRSVQAEAAAAQGAMERGSASVLAGVQRSAEAGEALEAITRAARESGRRTSEIGAAVQEQTRAASHVAVLMERVRAAADELRGAAAEQRAAHEVVRRGTATTREVAHRVRRTTEEQARGGSRLRQGIEIVRDEVDRIERALQDQSTACRRSAELMAAVWERARANEEAVERLARAGRDLSADARTLREELRRFKL